MAAVDFAVKGKVRKKLEGGMLLRTLPTTLLQIFCKSILDSEVSKVSEIQLTISRGILKG